MEYWGLKTVSHRPINLFLLEVSKKDFSLLNPLFQPSNIPSFHIICLRHSHFTLTCPEDKDFDVGLKIQRDRRETCIPTSQATTTTRYICPLIASRITSALASWVNGRTSPYPKVVIVTQLKYRK